MDQYCPDISKSLPHSCYNTSAPCFLAEAAKEDARFALQKRIEQLDKEIDMRVYRLYGLTEEEVKIVEGG